MSFTLSSYYTNSVPEAYVFVRIAAFASCLHFLNLKFIIPHWVPIFISLIPRMISFIIQLNSVLNYRPFVALPLHFVFIRRVWRKSLNRIASKACVSYYEYPIYRGYIIFVGVLVVPPLDVSVMLCSLNIFWSGVLEYCWASIFPCSQFGPFCYIF